MNEEYLLELYNYLSKSDPSYGNEVEFDSFKNEMMDQKYASKIYGYLSDLDPTFSDDVSVIDFINDINAAQVKKKEDGASALEDISLELQKLDEQRSQGETDLYQYQPGLTKPELELEIEEEKKRDKVRVSELEKEIKQEEDNKRQPLVDPSNQDFFELINNIDSDMIDREEEEVVPFLNNLFMDKGFIFESTSFGDALIAKTFDGNKSIKIDLDPFFSKTEVSEAKKLREFLSANAPTEKPKFDDEVTLSYKAKQIRPYGLINNKGEVEKYRFSIQEDNGVYKVVPTIFPVNPNKKSTDPMKWMSLDGYEAIEEAEKRGEVFEFKSKEEAEEFISKDFDAVSTIDFELDSIYNEENIDYFSAQKEYDEYIDVRDKISKLEQKKEDIVFSVDGELSERYDETLERLKEREEELFDNVFSEDKVRLREKADLYLDEKFKEASKSSAQKFRKVKSLENSIQQESLEEFGVTVDELSNIQPKTKEEFDSMDSLIVRYNQFVGEAKNLAAENQIATSYFDKKNNKALTSEIRDNFSGFLAEYQSGLSRGKASEVILGTLIGLDDLDTEEGRNNASKKIAMYFAEMDGPKSRAMSRWANAVSGKEQWEVFKDDPFELATTLAASSIGMMLPYGKKIIPAAAATGAATGAGIGALAGGAGAIPGTFAGLARGVQAGFAATSFAMEYSNAFFDAAQEKGYDMTDPQQVEKALMDQQVWATTNDIGVKRGLVIGAVDLVGGRIAGRVFKTSKVGSVGARAASLTTERLVVDPAFEMLGEGAAQVLSGQGLDAKEVFSEGLGGFGSQSPNMALNITSDVVLKNNKRLTGDLSRISYIASETASDKRISDWVNKQLQKKSITNEEAQKILDNVSLRREASDLLNVGTQRNKSDATISRLMSLLKAKRDLTATTNRREVYRDKISEINQEIKNISENKKIPPKEDQVNLDLIIGTEVSTPVYKIGQKIMSKERFIQMINQMSDEELKKANITVENDQQVQNEVISKFKKNAVQEQETREVPDAEQAEGVQEVEGEVRESDVETEEEVEIKPEDKKYAEDLKETKESNPEAYWSVDTVTEEDASKGTVIDTEDGAAVVGADGDIKGVFKKLKSKAKGVAQTLLKKAVEAGGTKLDNFVTGANGVKLQEIYEKAGFRVVSRTPFNEEFAPEGWTPKDGNPDVVAMVYDPNNELKFEERSFDSYDDMISYRDSVLEDVDSQEVQDLRSLIDSGSPRVDFRLKTETEQTVEDSGEIVEAINQIDSPLVDFSVSKKESSSNIDVEELNSRTDVPFKKTTLRVIEGVPSIFSITDQLTTGSVVNPETGNTIGALKGSIGFNGTEGNTGLAWANTTKKEAQDLIKKATEVYNKNKELYERFWSENPEYNGLVPMNIVKMGPESLISNEATFRVLSDNLKTIPSKNRRKALPVLKKEIRSKIKTLESKEKKSPADIKQIRLYKDLLSKIIKEKPKLIEEVLTTDFIKNISLPTRALLIKLVTSGSVNDPNTKSKKPGASTKPVPNTLLSGIDGGNAKINLGVITDLITDPQLRNVEIGDVVSIVGVDVINPSVESTTHPNYPFGAKGKSIGILETPQPMEKVYPKAFQNIMSQAIKSPVTAVKEEKVIRGRVLGVGIGIPSKDYIGAVANVSSQDLGKLLSFMNISFPSVNISSDASVFYNVISSDGVKTYLKGDEVIYGVTVDGDIYINPEVHDSDSSLFNTAIHEMGHVWTDYLNTTEKGRSIYEKGSELVKETEEYKRQLSIFDGDVDAAVNEAMAILIGNKGESIIDGANKSKFKEWLIGLWEYVRSQFKMSSDLTSEEIQDMSLDKFLETAIADILSGKEIKLTDNQMKQMKNPGAAFSKSMSMSSIVEIARNNGFSDESIRVVLKERGFKDSDITSALEVKIDLFQSIPKEFSNAEGGTNVGINLFNRVKDKINAFSKQGPRGGKGEKRTKSFSEIREKAQEILISDSVFQEQPEQVQLEMRSGLDRVLGIRSNPNVTREIGYIRNRLRERRISENNLKDAQRRMRTFVRKALPKSKNYSNRAINKLMKVINDTNFKNFNGQMTIVLSEVENQRQVLKGQVIDKIIGIVGKKAKTARTQSGKRRSSGLDAIGQSYFNQAKRVLSLAKKNDVDGLIGMQKEINQELLSDALEKLNNGEKITARQRELIDKQLALDSFSDVQNMSLEDVNELIKEVRVTRAESIARLNNRREARREAVNEIKEQFKSQISSDFSELYDEKGNLKNNNQLGKSYREIIKSFKSIGLLKSVEDLFAKFKKDKKYTPNTIQKYFRNNLLHLGTITNILDRGKDGMFTKMFYERLNDMDEIRLSGIYNKEGVMTKITNSLTNKRWRKWKYSLGSDSITLSNLKNTKTGASFETSFNKDQTMRIYALSLNPIQKEKLANQGITDSVLEEIKEFLGTDNVAIVEQVVDYFSNEYYNEINDVYVQANDVNLGYVENYFPTRTISTSEDVADMINGDFSSVFSTDTAPQFKERVNRTDDVDLNDPFTSVVESYIETMERYRAFALGVKQMDQVYKSSDIQALLKETGLNYVFNMSLNYAINPDSGRNPSDGVVSWLQRQFTGFALAFKPIQVVKQATSFVQAYEDYQLVKGKRIPALDLLAFMADYAMVVATLPKQIREAKEISSTFKDRIDRGLEGDVFGLESGGRMTRRTPGRISRGFRKSAGFFTVAGDILGVLGYKAVYNRNIRNGMSKSEALSKFNNYNATQQTRRSTEKVPLQQDTKFVNKFFTMFGSTILLQMNKTLQSSNNILKSIGKKEVPKAKDIRALALNASVANVLFTAASYSGSLIKGDDEDRDRAWRAIKDAAVGLNLAYQTPIMGAAMEYAVNRMRGEYRPSSEGVNPVTNLISKIIKSYNATKDGDIIKGVKPILEISIGAQIDAPIGLFNIMTEGGDDEDYYDVLGISPSYRPGYGRRKKSKKKSTSPMSKSDIKKYFPDMYEDFYGDDNQVTFDEDDFNVDDMAEKIMKEIYDGFKP